MTDPLVPDDPLLPAASSLTGPAAIDVVAAAVAAAGGACHRLTVEQVAYRPGHELVVRYAADVSWAGGVVTHDTLFAGATTDGAPTGTIPVEATDGDRTLEVGVWRWPFDPALPMLGTAVDPVALAAWRDTRALPVVAAVAHRACRRAVVRATWPSAKVDGSDHVEFVKVLAPLVAERVVHHHERFAVAGVPVPEVLHAAPDGGLVAFAALPGDDLRTRLLVGDAVPGGHELVELVDRIATVELLEAGERSAGGACPSLLRAATHHASMLARVLPAAACVLGDLVEQLSVVAATLPAPRRATVHGDLHEAQLRVGDDGRLIGVLDVDDAHWGDPLDDLARATAHLIGLATIGADSTSNDAVERLVRHAERVQREIEQHVDVAPFRVRLAAALVGLATVPFCTQTMSWQRESAALVHRAHRVLDGIERGDRRMRTPSATAQSRLIDRCEN